MPSRVLFTEILKQRFHEVTSVDIGYWTWWNCLMKRNLLFPLRRTVPGIVLKTAISKSKWHQNEAYISYWRGSYCRNSFTIPVRMGTENKMYVTLKCIYLEISGRDSRSVEIGFLESIPLRARRIPSKSEMVQLTRWSIWHGMGIVSEDLCGPFSIESFKTDGSDVEVSSHGLPGPQTRPLWTF
jgi:hypothetical protein